MKMLYLISQNDNNHYDTYDSAIVCAESEEQARTISPSSFYVWDESIKSWCFHFNNGLMKLEIMNSWVDDLSLITVKCIGKADKSVDIGVVCASYNAG